MKVKELLEVVDNTPLEKARTCMLAGDKQGALQHLKAHIFNKSKLKDVEVLKICRWARATK